MDDRKAQIRRECGRRAREAIKRVGMSAWYDHGRDVLSPEELLEVKRHWDALPGSSCWLDAFLLWMREG